MNEQVKNLLIGIFIIAACSLLVSIILFLRPKVGDEKQTLYVRFSNINKINIGTRVTFAGKPVGEVVAINEIFDARTQPVDLLGNLYYYQLTLHIDSGIKVYDTDQISLQTSGLLGEKSVAILPRPPKAGVIAKLVTNQPIYAESGDPIENAFVQLSEVADNMNIVLKETSSWLQENKTALSHSVESFGDAMDEIACLTKEIREQNVLGDVKSAIAQFSGNMQQVHKALDELHKNRTFANIGSITNNLKSASESIDVVTQDLANGTGTLGKLIKGDDMYLRITSLMSKVDTLMNDVNHYGILFHLNKSWQRTRLKRLNEMNALESPGDFKNYFETEVSDINTAMSRISMLINRAEQSPQKSQILKSEPFKKDFAELMRQTDALLESLKLYNQQLTEAAN